MHRPTPHPVRIDAGGVLCCPLCGWAGTYFEDVRVAARDEDRAPNNVTVNAVTGVLATHSTVPVPAGRTSGEGRRQRIAVAGWCAECRGSFALVLTQHRGVTFIEWAVDGVPDMSPEAPDDAGPDPWEGRPIDAATSAMLSDIELDVLAGRDGDDGAGR